MTDHRIIIIYFLCRMSLACNNILDWIIFLVILTIRLWYTDVIISFCLRLHPCVCGLSRQRVGYIIPQESKYLYAEFN